MTQTFTFTQCREIFLSFFEALLYIYVLCYFITKKDSFHNIKNHVKSSGITKRLCFVKNAFWCLENKGLRIAFKPICCKCTQKVVNMWILLGLWGQRSSPIQTVQGLWHLTTCFLPTRLCTAKKTKRKTDGGTAPKWWVKAW